MVPTISKQERQKRGSIMSLITGFISLTYKGISNFLHYKRQNNFAQSSPGYGKLGRLTMQQNFSFRRLNGPIWHI